MQLKAQSLKSDLCKLLFYEVICFACLKFCSGWVKTPRIEVKPIGRCRKRRRPYHTVKDQCNRGKRTILLYLCCFVTAARAVAEDRKHYDGHNGEKNNDNEHFDSGK